MKVSVFVLASLILLATAAMPCDQNCMTEIKIVDCDGASLPGATVTVTCISGGTKTEVTNKDGIVRVHVCTHEIKDIAVTVAATESSGPCKSSPCTIKVCFPAS